MLDQPRRIAIATDAWQPQVNGVVRTLNATVQHLRGAGHDVRVIEPGLFVNAPVPFYPDVHLSMPNPWQVDDLLAPFKPDHVHIATEGPIGLTVRAYCGHRDWRFTTSFHTRFPEYLDRLIGLPTSLSYGYLKWFHRPARAVMVATPSIEKDLLERGFADRVRRWSRGVDLSLFHPRPSVLPADHRPVAMYVGRVSTEKNIEAFLTAATPGRKYVVGGGPQRAELEAAYPDVTFVGAKSGEELAAHYASADVFVFPSKTDTFGLVILEALASGVPVAGYPVPGPIDIVRPPETGALDDDLGAAIDRALRDGRRAACISLAQEYTWQRCTEQFLNNLIPSGDGERSFPI